MRTQQTDDFAKWFSSLRDTRTRSVIAKRIARIQIGLMGDVEPVGDGVSEVRIHFGPGCRLYFTMRGGDLVILLVGGDKGNQSRDIAKARVLASRIP